MEKKKRLSLSDKARIANGRSHQCEACPFKPCSLVQAHVCGNAFQEGYIKGYRQSRKEFVKPKTNKI